MANILIMGGESLIGQAMRTYLGSSHNVSVTTRNPGAGFSEKVRFLDALHPSLSDIDFRQYNIVINVIAQSKFENCRRNPEQSRKINLDFPLNIVRKLPKATRFIQFSTSAVFSCDAPFQSADDFSLPRSEYGLQKKKADDGVLAEGGEVFRITKVLVPNDILGEMLRKLKQGKPVEVYRDLYLCPLSLDCVMRAIRLVVECGRSSIYQLSGDMDLSYEGVLRQIAKNHNCDQNLIIPKTCKDEVYPDHIMKYSSMEVSELFNCDEPFDLNHQNLIRQIYG